MSFALSIEDQTSSGDVVSNIVIQFPVETITVKELIESRVEKEFETYIKDSTKTLFNLVTPKKSEEELNGQKIRKKKRGDVAEQKAVALHAFQNNGFFLLVNDKQLIELDDLIQITPKSKIVFFRLIPVIGG